MFLFVLTLFCQLWGHHVYVCYGQMMGANKPSRGSVPWIFVLLICNNWNERHFEFEFERAVTWSFDVFFDMCLNKQLSKQSRCWWIETPSCPLWRHCNDLTHLGRIMRTNVSKLSYGSESGVSLIQRQAIIWANNDSLINRVLGTNFSEICIATQAFIFKEMHSKMSAK